MCVSVQALSMFSSALASGQLGPLMNQFGLPAEAVDAANKGGQCFTRIPETKHSLISMFCIKKRNEYAVAAEI